MMPSTFIRALGFDKVDIFSFSLGGMVAQALVVKHPDLVRKLILTGTGPAGGKDIDKVAGTTYFDMLRAALTRSDPKEFLFFNRNPSGKRAAKAFVERLKERTVDRDAPITVKAFRTQLKAIKKWGRSAPADLSKITQPTLIANGDNDRMVPSVLSEDLHRRIKGSELIIYPDSGHGGIFQFHDKFAARRRRVPRPLTGIRSHPKGRAMTSTVPYTKKSLASSILLWMRTDQPRQQGMDYWKGPHSKIISATPGFEEYRQLHLAETNPGLWPAIHGVETAIPADRRIDGVAEVTFASALVAVAGPQADQARVQGRSERVPAHPALRRAAELGPLVRRRPARRENGGSGPDLPQETRRRRHRTVPQAHHRRARARSREHGRADRAANPGVHALEREALGHAQRRARQPHRPAAPRLADPRLRRRSRASGVLRQRPSSRQLSDRLSVFASAVHAYRCPKR